MASSSAGSTSTAASPQTHGSDVVVEASTGVPTAISTGGSPKPSNSDT